MFGTTLEVSVFKDLDSTGVVVGDRCRTRMDGAKFGCKFATVVHLLSAKSTKDTDTRTKLWKYLEDRTSRRIRTPVMSVTRVTLGCSVPQPPKPQDPFHQDRLRLKNKHLKRCVLNKRHLFSDCVGGEERRSDSRTEIHPTGGYT